MVGANLQSNWEDFEIIFWTSKELTTNKHKTEKFYTVHVRILEDRRKFLRKKEKVLADFYFYLFPSFVK